MARLNEPAVPTESIDALKRRFVRQNREIARANSTQSLRIRTLEGETSQLLADNIALREQVIKLQAEVDKNASTRALEDVDGVKGKIIDRLKELGDIVGELGALTIAPRRALPSPKSSRPPKRSPRLSLDGNDWKNTLTLSEATAAQEGRLPPIVEDKYYPRLSLNADELLDVLSDPADTTDSPDLGPPPVAHLEDEEPGRAAMQPGSMETGLDPDLAMHRALPANLETRRRRRDSVQLSEYRKAIKSMSSTTAADESSRHVSTGREQTLKTGAKRKLDVREAQEVIADGTPDVRKVADSETFGLGEKIKSPRKESRVVERASKDRAAARGIRDESKAASSVTASSRRKALGPKDRNTDPASPRKAQKAESKGACGNDKDGAAKNESRRDRDRERRQAVEIARDRVKLGGKEDEGGEIKTGAVVAEPETPAGLNLFSPASSEPSAARPSLRDTPPPPELNPLTSTSDTLGMTGRAARRPRGAVNYAEPNLRDKMRRPTKVLVDAVTGEGRARRGNSLRLESGRSESEDGGSGADGKEIRTVVIKKEDGTDADWKKMPDAPQPYRVDESSPLTSKVSANLDESERAPSNFVSQRRRRVSVLRHEDAQPQNGKSTSASAAAISALVAGSRKGREGHKRGREREAENDDARFDIYEFDGTSPNLRVGESDRLNRSQAMVSQTSNRTAKTQPDVPRASLASDGDSAARGDAALSRPSSQQSRGRRQTLGRTEFSGSSGSTDLDLSGGDAVLEEGSERGARGERAAARRRSMML